jgi:pimeloyl-ACP methyl ester carboxylesterase
MATNNYGVRYRTVSVDSVKIFYREAGDSKTPTLLLLHGFPTSSHMFRDLIPLLSDRYHIVAPDLPGFGFSDTPDRAQFKYTFEHLAEVIDRFAELVSLQRYALYIFDYGAPVGLRLALKHPERVTAIVSQNGNAYEEGLSDGWNPIEKLHTRSRGWCVGCGLHGSGCYIRRRGAWDRLVRSFLGCCCARDRARGWRPAANRQKAKPGAEGVGPSGSLEA